MARTLIKKHTEYPFHKEGNKLYMVKGISVEIVNDYLRNGDLLDSLNITDANIKLFIKGDEVLNSEVVSFFNNMISVHRMKTWMPSEFIAADCKCNPLGLTDAHTEKYIEYILCNVNKSDYYLIYIKHI